MTLQTLNETQQAANDEIGTTKMSPKIEALPFAEDRPYLSWICLFSSLSLVHLLVDIL